MKFLETTISMNQMDESDVSASVASPADYISYFARSSSFDINIDAYAAIITAHLPPNTLSAESI